MPLHTWSLIFHVYFDHRELSRSTFIYSSIIITREVSFILLLVIYDIDLWGTRDVNSTKSEPGLFFLSPSVLGPMFIELHRMPRQHL